MIPRLTVVKIGTSSITSSDGKLDEGEMCKLVSQIATSRKEANRIVLVTSGAVASGIAELGLPPKSNDIVFQQAAAATGQSVLMTKYREMFKVHDIKVAQILLTAEDLSNRTSYLHTINVLKMLLKIGVIPIVNENDVTSIDELMPVTEGYRINFSDNDILSALLASAIRADALVILSDVDGLYTMDPQNPEAIIIKTVDNITPELIASFEGKNPRGKGGIQSKIKAAEIATKSGIPVVIANSRRDNVILEILAGKEVGTYFKSKTKVPAMKMWIAYGASVKGKIFVNEGAKKAILQGSSLLPVGVTRVMGQFKSGDVVSIVDQDSVEFAKGNTNYSSEEISMVQGFQLSKIREKLNLVPSKEVVWRKRMHLTGE